jgi:H+/Cl- antiporter ClcA
MVLLRTLLLGVMGAIGGALGLVVASFLAGDDAIRWVYLPAAGGFIGGAVANLINETLGFYKGNALGKLFRRLFKR